MGGAATGAVVGGPVGSVVGGVVGAVVGHTADPPAEVKIYVRTQRVDPVHYDGQIVVGATLPDTVTEYDVPRYERYRWTYINGQRLLIDRQSHNIVSIINDEGSPSKLAGSGAAPSVAALFCLTRRGATAVQRRRDVAKCRRGPLRAAGRLCLGGSDPIELPGPNCGTPGVFRVARGI